MDPRGFFPHVVHALSSELAWKTSVFRLCKNHPGIIAAAMGNLRAVCGSGLGAEGPAAGQGQEDFNDFKSNPHLCEDRAGILRH